MILLNSKKHRDFTYDVYKKLIRSATENNYEFLKVKEYLSRENLPEKFIIMRHDVDRKPKNAIDFARIEADLDIYTSYYFRASKNTFRPNIIKKISKLGHEIGYHYEDVDQERGNTKEALNSFSYNLNKFRKYVNIETVSMHGNPLTPYDNRDLWGRANFNDYNLLGEVYLSVDFTEVVYFSDTNRTWFDKKTIVNDNPRGQSVKPEQINSTFDLIDLIERNRFSRIYLLSHPNRWAATYFEWLEEATKDNVINAGKYGLWILRLIKNKFLKSENHG